MSVLHQFHSLASNPKTSFDEKVTDIIKLGLEAFSLDLGIVSKITNSIYLVSHSVDKTNQLKPGMQLSLGNTYCCHTIAAKKSLGFHQADAKDIAFHPAYIEKALESYIGAPIFMEGNAVGTINFSSLHPRKPFTEEEFDYIELFAQWLGEELSIQTVVEQLKKNHQTLQKLERAAKIGTWELDLIEETLVWSPQTKQIHEVSENFQPTLENAIEFYLEGESRNKIQACVQRAIETGNAFHVELPILTAKGNEVWLSSFGEAEFDNGKCIKIFGVAQDITAQYTQRKLLDETSSRMKLATNSGQIGIWELDLLNDELIWDDWMYKLYGLAPNSEKSTYELWASFVHPDDRASAIENIQKALDTGSNFDSEFRIIWRDGSIHYIRGTAIIENDENRTPIKMTGVNIDITEQTLLTNRVSYQASHDSLTGLKNRSEFEKQLSELVKHSKDSNRSHSLFFIDLDNFKIINDTCGHAVGDKAIVSAGKVFAQFVRKEDVVARIGGDEFGIILKGCAIQFARKVAKNICDEMEVFRFACGETKFRIGASIGLIEFDNAWTSSSDIMKAADKACYIAKEQGRNRFHEYSETDEALNVRQGEINWINRIEDALSNDKFCLYFQYIEPLKRSDGQLCLEVLLRLPEEADKTHVISPGSFLPAAERYQLVSRIDKWVLNNTLTWLHSLSYGKQKKIDMISVNLSGQSIEDKEFKKYCFSVLSKQPKLLRAKICLEITETVAISNLFDASHFVNKIKDLGVLIALDDFGSGSSTFSYLKNLDIDILKIDGQFIKGIFEDPLDEVAVKSFVDIAKIKNLKTVAEWVENQAAWDKLKSLDVDFAQGYFIHTPSKIESLLDQQSS